MKGDFTRFSHQPRKNYAAVLMQQGRVQLDADWNEQYEIEDHRWRVQTIDTIGACGVPNHAAGFGLSLAPGGAELLISAGRIYVDGVLCELRLGSPVAIESFPAADRVVTAALDADGEPFAVGGWVEVFTQETEAAETSGTFARIAAINTAASELTLDADVSAHQAGTNPRLRRVATYATQPDYPPPLATPLNPVDGQTDLAYLDVWRRHVTAVEDPKLREVALGGPDTATRLQTVCQVKLLRDVGDINCTDDLDAWDALVAESAGRMSARAAAAPDPDDPCLIAPGAGYRGLENRLYRVEVHDPGALGTATFKWSRDNGSILAAVVNFIGGPLNQIQVSSLGRDQVLRFRIGDWVEVFSDENELADPPGAPGTMAQVTDVDEAQRILMLSVDVSVHAGKPRPRVRRWDQTTSVVTTAGPWLDLEDGVQVGFSGGPFRSGDYWLIPARTATGDVEGFTSAPPRGIRHHYCRLALITWSVTVDATGNELVTAEIRDCRPHFPPLTEVPTGGANCCTVTVGDGVTSRGDTTDIQAAVDAVIASDRAGRVCILPGLYNLSQTVVIRGREVLVSGCGPQTRIRGPDGSPAFEVEGSLIRLESLTIVAQSPEGAIVVRDSQVIRVADCQATNTLEASFQPGAVAGETFTAAAPGEAGKLLGPVLVVSDSRFVTVVDNIFRGLPCVAARADDARIAGNTFGGGGVWVRDGSDTVTVADNEISGGRGPGIALGGMMAKERPSDRATGVQRTEILGNRILGMEHSGITTVLNRNDDAFLLGDVEDLTIAHNRIVGCALEKANSFFEPLAVGGIVLREAARVRIHANHIADNGAAAGVAACGIFVFRCLAVEASGNTVLNNGSSKAGDDRGSLQGGIVGLLVVGGDRAAAGQKAGWQAGPPAALVHDNVVVCPKGQALILYGIGPMSVADNTLTSRGLIAQPIRQLDFGRAVFILNLGRGSVLSSAMMKSGASTNFHRESPAAATPEFIRTAPAVASRQFPDGRVLVHGNQVTLEAEERAGLQSGAAVAIATYDDASLQDNQIAAEVPGIVFANTFAWGATVRATGNRFSELPGRALFSYVSLGLMNLATGNQGTHCIQVAGGNPAIDADNQVLITAFCDLLGKLVTNLKLKG